jgi:hypothetical protein
MQKSSLLNLNGSQHYEGGGGRGAEKIDDL